MYWLLRTQCTWTDPCECEARTLGGRNQKGPEGTNREHECQGRAIQGRRIYLNEQQGDAGILLPSSAGSL